MKYVFMIIAIFLALFVFLSVFFAIGATSVTIDPQSLIALGIVSSAFALSSALYKK